MFKKTIVTAALFASLALTTFASAQSVRDKAVKAAYQGPEARFLKIKGKAFNVKKAKVRLGPGTRIVDGQIAYVKPFPINSGIKVSYTMVFRRDGTLVDVAMRGASSAGVYDAITKQTSTSDLVDGSWKGSVRYLIAEIGRAVPRDMVGFPFPQGQLFPFPEETRPPGELMDGDEGNYDPGNEGDYDAEEDEGDLDTETEDEGDYETENEGDGGDETGDEEESGGNLPPQNYFLGVSTSLVKIPSGHGNGGHGYGGHGHGGHGQQYSQGQQRFSGDSYGLRINSVVPGSPAQRTGLEPGDIVISANQKPMNQQDSLTMAVAESNGQLDLIVRNVRNGHSVAVVVKLDAQTSTFQGMGTRQRRR